jgi:hypothetical protein
MWGKHKVPGTASQRDGYVPTHTVTTGNGRTSNSNRKPKVSEIRVQGTVPNKAGSRSRLRLPKWLS